ncbi:MAG: ABC transporter permease [Nocardioidaceae bacterium]
MDWEWISSNTVEIGGLLGDHVYLAIVPIVAGLVVALVVGALGVRFPRLYPPIVALSSTFYTIPSLALFVIMPGLIGTQILDPINVIIALTIYSASLLVRNVMDGLRATSPEVRQSALSMGYTPIRQLWEIDLPIAMPLVFAGLRVATVANISMVSVGALIGVGGLGELFTQGFQRRFYTPLLVGLVLSVLLALLADALLVLLQRWLTPWARLVR